MQQGLTQAAMAKHGSTQKRLIKVQRFTPSLLFPFPSNVHRSPLCPSASIAVKPGIHRSPPLCQIVFSFFCCQCHYCQLGSMDIQLSFGLHLFTYLSQQYQGSILLASLCFSCCHCVRSSYILWRIIYCLDLTRYCINAVNKFICCGWLSVLISALLLRNFVLL